MAFFSEAGIPTAHPIPDNNNEYIRTLKGKPAALVRRLNGVSIDIPNSQQCIAIGSKLAQMHVLGEKFKLSRQTTRDDVWRTKTAALVMSKLSDSEQTLLNQEITYLKSASVESLSTTVIHADLFRDNVLFIGDEVTGIIDFYYAYNGYAIYDLAITVNDWCSSEYTIWDMEKLSSLLVAYQAVRPISEKERNSWVYVLRLAALRFWLSRLRDKHFPRSGEITHTKNPDTFKAIVEHHSSNQDLLMDVW